jgi:hypothetical protein
VRDAVARHGNPMDVADPALAARIYREYVALLDAGLPQRIQPLITALQAQGFTARTIGALPIDGPPGIARSPSRATASPTYTPNSRIGARR